MGFSIWTLAVVLFCLLAALAVLLVVQVLARRAGSARPTVAPTIRAEIVWAACPAAFVGVWAGVFAFVPFALTFGSFDSVPAAITVPWMIMWGLGPCVVVGYLSGRWWSFVGALPLLVLWPVGVMLETTDASANADLFSTLPLTAAIAVALALGSAGRFWRDRRVPVEQDRATPAAAGSEPASPIAEPPPESRPPYWPPPPPGWRPVPNQAAQELPVSAPPRDPPPFWPPPPGWKPSRTHADEGRRAARADRRKRTAHGIHT